MLGHLNRASHSGLLLRWSLFLCTQSSRNPACSLPAPPTPLVSSPSLHLIPCAFSSVNLGNFEAPGEVVGRSAHVFPKHSLCWSLLYPLRDQVLEADTRQAVFLCFGPVTTPPPPGGNEHRDRAKLQSRGQIPRCLILHNCCSAVEFRNFLFGITPMVCHLK